MYVGKTFYEYVNTVLCFYGACYNYYVMNLYFERTELFVSALLFSML